MRRIAIIVIMILTAVAGSPLDMNSLAPRLTLHGEYRQDALDYDNADKRFIRDSASLAFGQSSVNFTHINVAPNNENRFTWNISIRGLTPYFESIVGNYYANFGAGMVVGKKSAVSPDLFSRTLAASRGRPFAPCNTGNPYFCFQGITAGFICPLSQCTLSLHGFYSFKNRYVKIDRMQQDATGTSLSSILIRTRPDFRYSEPVVIQDAGCAIMARALDHLSIQSYFIHTSIKLSSSKDFFWNYSARDVPTAEKKFFAYGVYFQYQDDYILVFLDCAFTNRVITSAVYGTRTVRGYGFMYSLAFRHPRCTVSFTGKQTDKNFYTPYGSGKNYPEIAVVAGLSLRPWKYCAVGGSFFSEKNPVPSRNEEYLRVSRREKVFVRAGVPLKGTVSFTALFAEETTKGGNKVYHQLRSSARIYILKSILFSMSGMMQKKNSSVYSGSLNGGLSFTLFYCLTLRIRYSHFFIAPRDSLFATVSRPAGSIRNDMPVANDSDLVSGALSIRLNGIRISAEYFHQFHGARTIQNVIEASGTFQL